MFYGFGASPILVDDKVILPVDQDHPASYLIAVDKNTGKLSWKVERPIVISGYSTPIIYQPKQGPKQIVVPESFQLSAYSVEDGKRVWWVRGLACEMKSIASQDSASISTLTVGAFRRTNPDSRCRRFRLTKRWRVRQRQRSHDREGRSNAARRRWTTSCNAAFEAFDMNRDEKLDAKDWEVFRAMMASENGLLAIKMGGEGDQTATAIRWRYQKPVPQVPSTLLYKGVLYMINDSGILISFDPATGEVLNRDGCTARSTSISHPRWRRMTKCF